MILNGDNYSAYIAVFLYIQYIQYCSLPYSLICVIVYQ